MSFEINLEKLQTNNPGMTELAQEIGVPVDYLMLGFAASGEFFDQVMPCFSTFEEYRAGIIEDYAKALTTKVLLVLFNTDTKTLQFNGCDYREKDINLLAEKVKIWVLNNGGNVGREKKGCYVATAIYGSYDCPEVWVLRRFRDESLSISPFGRAFVRTYYAISPTVVKRFGNKAWFNRFVKARLDSFVSNLAGRGFSSDLYID